MYYRFHSIPYVTVLMVTLCGCAAKREEDPRLLPPVVPVTKVHAGHAEGNSYTGLVKARVESFLGFRVGGKVTQRLVDVGQKVQAGQPVMRIDRTDYAHSIVARQGNVESAQARVVQAEADEKRYKNALEVGVVTEQSFDQIKSVADVARADLKANEALTNVARDEADYSILLSDVDGVVTETLAEPGQVVAVGQTVIKVARKGPREAAVDLPETLRPSIGSYAEAKVYDSAIPPCKAKLRQLSDSADKATRTFEARYVLTGAAADAPLGATITIVPLGTVRAKGVSVPLTAIVDKGKGPNVWLVNTAISTVSLRPVHISVLGEEEAILADGLQTGDTIVVQGAHLLHSNEKIRIEKTSTVTAAAPLATPPQEVQ